MRANGIGDRFGQNELSLENFGLGFTFSTVLTESALEKVLSGLDWTKNERFFRPDFVEIVLYGQEIKGE